MASKSIHCELCGKLGQSAKAHIIPEAFYRVSRGDEVPGLFVFSNSPGHRKKARPVGVYDQELLCQSCESKLQALDEYGVQVFLRDPRQDHPHDEGSRVIEPIDVSRIERFVAFVAWRAMASQAPEFRPITASALMTKLRKILNEDLPLAPGDIEIFFELFRPETLNSDQFSLVLNGSAWMDAIAETSCCCFGLGDVIVWVNITGHNFPPPIHEQTLRSQGRILLLHAPNHSNRHLERIRKVVIHQDEATKTMNMAARVMRRFKQSFGRG